ncbi:RNA polymerase sigma-70 factor [Reichenbachiella sp. MALMAid0571]|uniref:RNA polymerase sigma factor n=1 Tax=Reichenbachiella sp. MALMAid0571 TaxID=3143939 RepID=UPI0032DE999E
MKDQNMLDESEILLKLKNGEQNAFRQIFSKYSPYVYNVSLQYLNSKSESEEIVQEVFFKVWLHRSKIKEDLPFAPYVVSIAKNLIFNKSKHQLVEQAYLQHLSHSPNIAGSFTENNVHFKEIKKITEHYIENLPLVRKEVFKLSRNENLSNKEIAHQLNIAERTVENHIYRALKSLKLYLKSRGYLELSLLLTFLQ